MSHFHFATDGTCYQLAGDVSIQPVVVLVHGVGLSQDLWRDWVAVLQNQYAIVCFDLLGHGQSPNPAGARALGDFSKQLERLTSELGIQRYHLIGFSLGALIALYQAAKTPDRLLSLVLLHSVFERSEKQLAAIESRYELTREQGPMATVEVAIKRWFSSDWVDRNPEVIESIRQVFRAHTDDGYLKAYRVFCDADDEIKQLDLANVGCKSLMITGSLEPGSTPAMSEALAQKLGGDVVINEGHLHMALVEHADALMSQVKQFMEQSK